MERLTKNARPGSGGGHAGCCHYQGCRWLWEPSIGTVDVVDLNSLLLFLLVRLSWLIMVKEARQQKQIHPPRLFMFGIRSKVTAVYSRLGCFQQCLCVAIVWVIVCYCYLWKCVETHRNGRGFKHPGLQQETGWPWANGLHYIKFHQPSVRKRHFTHVVRIRERFLFRTVTHLPLASSRICLVSSDTWIEETSGWLTAPKSVRRLL